jgi:hypothetical protein
MADPLQRLNADLGALAAANELPTRDRVVNENPAKQAFRVVELPAQHLLYEWGRVHGVWAHDYLVVTLTDVDAAAIAEIRRRCCGAAPTTLDALSALLPELGALRRYVERWFGHSELAVEVAADVRALFSVVAAGVHLEVWLAPTTE